MVKVARVDEDGVIKYSAYTDMQRIFKTVPPPYRVGTRTADAYIPATDDQRKYMERELAVCEYVNLPKNNRMEVLAYIIADLKAENIELEQRVHQLVDDYNNVARQLRGMENTEQKRFAKAIHAFIKDKNLYLKKFTNCPYYQDGPHVCSTFCLKCDSCLGILDGLGVICEKKPAETKVSFLVKD